MTACATSPTKTTPNQPIAVASNARTGRRPADTTATTTVATRLLQAPVAATPGTIARVSHSMAALVSNNTTNAWAGAECRVEGGAAGDTARVGGTRARAVLPWQRPAAR